MIDTSFFRTKQFVIAAVIATLLLGAGAATYTLGGIASGWSSIEGCRVTMEGAALPSEPGVVVDNGGRSRTVVYSIDATGFNGGSLVACSPVGEILVEPSPDDLAHVEYRIRGDSVEAVAATDVRAGFFRVDGGLGVAAWQQVVGESTGLFGTRSVEVTVLIRLPATGPFDVSLASNVGDLRVVDTLVGNLDLHTDVGELRALDVDVQGNVSASSEVGDIILALRSVQSGTIDVTSEVGEVEVGLPLRADVGYDVVAHSDVGEVTVRLGETERYTSESEGVGGRVEARSQDYGSKPTKLEVTVISGVGDVRIAAA